MNICIVLTPSIGKIGKKGIAGTERMFLKDIELLKNNYGVKAFARFEYTSPSINKLKYPQFLINLSFYLKFSHRIFYFTHLLLDFFANIFFLIQVVLKNNSADIYLGYSYPSIALLNKPTKVIFLHSYERFFFPRFLSAYYKKAHYIFVSHYLKEHYFTHYNFFNEQNSTVLHNSIDEKLFKPKKITPRESKKIRLLYSSAWEKEKGLHLLLNANSKLSPKLREKVEITIASNSDLWYHEKFDSNAGYVKKIQQLLKLNTNSNVTLLKGVPHEKMPSLYQTHDFLLFPSTWGEPCSLGLIESLACGLPVIAFPVGGNKEILSKSNSILGKEISEESLLAILKSQLQSRKKTVRKNLFTRKNFYMLDSRRAQKLYHVIAHLD